MARNFGTSGTVGEILPSGLTSIPSAMTFVCNANLNAWTPRFGGTGYKTLASIPTGPGEVTISLAEFGAVSPAFRIAGDSLGGYFQFDSQFATALTNDEHYAMTMDFSSVSNVPTFYEGGSALSTTTSSAPTTGFSSAGTAAWHMGTTNYSAAALEFSFTGDLWDWAIYNVILTADEIGQLAAGISPLQVRPESIYALVRGIEETPIEFFTGTATTAYGSGTTLGNVRATALPRSGKIWQETTTVVNLSATFTGAYGLSAAPAFSQNLTASFAASAGMSASITKIADEPQPLDANDGQDIFLPTGGQSNNLGTGGAPALSTTQYEDSVNGALTALVESGVETYLSAMAAVVRAADGGTNSRRFIAENYGASGQDYANLQLGSTVWNTMIAAITATDTAAGGDTTIPAFVFTHGESDDADNCNGTTCSNVYRTFITQYYTDLNTTFKGITGQTRDIALIVSQLSNWTQNNKSTSVVPTEQLAAVDSSNYILMAMPRYAMGDQGTLIYSTDGVHNNNLGHRLAGEYYGQVLREVFVEGRTWTPLRMITVVVPDGAPNTLVITYTVPATRMGTESGGVPLVLDTTACAAAISSGSTTYGFEVEDGSPNPRYVTGVSVSGSEVTLTLNGNVRAGSTVRYALRGIPEANGGNGLDSLSAGSARGNVRDTSSRVGVLATTEGIVNWAVAEARAITDGSGETPPSSVATIYDDRNWTWAYIGDSTNYPSSGTGNWPAQVGGVELTHQTGTATLNQSTTIGGATPYFGSIGSNRLSRGTDPNGAVWRGSDALFSKAASDDILIRFVGNIRRPDSNGYVLWINEADTNNQFYVQFTAAGAVFVRFGSDGQDMTYAASGVLPETDTLGLIDIYVRMGPVLQTKIAVNGVVATSTSSVAGGAFSGNLSLFGAFNNTQPFQGRVVSGVLASYGHAAGWWSEDAHTTDYNRLIFSPTYLNTANFTADVIDLPLTAEVIVYNLNGDIRA